VCVTLPCVLFVFRHGLAFIFPSRKQQQKLRNAKLTLHLRKWANTNIAEIEESRWVGAAKGNSNISYDLQVGPLFE